MILICGLIFLNGYFIKFDTYHEFLGSQSLLCGENEKLMRFCRMILHIGILSKSYRAPIVPYRAGSPSHTLFSVVLFMNRVRLIVMFMNHLRYLFSASSTSTHPETRFASIKRRNSMPHNYIAWLVRGWVAEFGPLRPGILL